MYAEANIPQTHCYAITLNWVHVLQGPSGSFWDWDGLQLPFQSGKKSQQLGALIFQEALHPVLVGNKLTSSAFVPLHFISFLWKISNLLLAWHQPLAVSRGTLLFLVVLWFSLLYKADNGVQEMAWWAKLHKLEKMSLDPHHACRASRGSVSLWSPRHRSEMGRQNTQKGAGQLPWSI